VRVARARGAGRPRPAERAQGRTARARRQPAQGGQPGPLGAAQVNPHALRRWVSTGDPASRLAVELWFDGEDTGRLTEAVAYFASPRRPLRFAWGEFGFDGHVEALEETLDSFSPEGRPLRARLSLSLRGETLPA
jgi:hypothetical protein